MRLIINLRSDPNARTSHFVKVDAAMLFFLQKAA